MKVKAKIYEPSPENCINISATQLPKNPKKFAGLSLVTTFKEESYESYDMHEINIITPS